MFKIIAPLCGLALAAAVYAHGTTVSDAGDCCGTCPAPKLVSAADASCGTTCPAPSSVLLLDASAGPATTAPSAVDVRNTKCIVMSDDDASAKTTVTYNGKTYHTCCKDCIAEFNKNPEKYVKAFDADPAKYGVKK